MKKLFTFSIMMVCAIFGFSQEYIQQPTAINTWTYVYDYDAELPFDKNITLQYDEKGNLSYYEHVINYPGSPYTQVYWFTHDALNRLTYKQSYFQEAADFGTKKYYYSYDESSNLTECLVKRRYKGDMYLTNEFIIESKDIYQYENGKKIRWDHLVDSTLTLQNYYLYDYSENGDWSSETKYKANGQPITKTEHTYSNHQEVLTDTKSNWSAETETWVISTLTEYEYIEGVLVEKRITSWSNEVANQQKQLYDYDESGNCTQILFQAMVDSVFADQNRAIYLYDENNLCTNAYAQRWNDTAWVLGGFPSGTYLLFDDIYDDVNDAIGSIAYCTRAEVTSYVTTPNPANFTPTFDVPNHYGFLCQPDSANIELDPNSYLGYEYGDDFYAKFTYHPNGLLNTQYTYSISYDYGNTFYAHYHVFHFSYDSEYHVIQQNDDYLIGGDEPFINHYIYDNGLLMTFTRHFDNYHENIMVLYDSISYAYDEQRQLQVEQRFNSLPLPEHAATVKNHEYLENKIIINTTDYFSGEWLSRETRTFNEDSLLVSSQTEKHNDSTVLVTYGYDEQGHQTSILTQKRNNGVWENQKLVQYLFNPYGRLTLAEIQLWQDDAFVDAHRAVYELNEMGYPATVTFEKWDGEAWVDGVWQSDFYLYDENHLKQQNDMFYEARNCIHKIELNYLVTENPREPFLPDGAEWYYEIINDNGSITYQYLQCAGDTTINDKRPKVIVRSNTQYDKDLHTEVTHEYVYEENGVVYWWNKELEEFTTLYDLTAKAGDEWEIRVGTESITVHVDSIGDYNFGGKTFRALYVSDSYGYYNGNILCGIGHLGSFFPERLMNQGKNYRVEGMRCYWVDGILVFKNGDEDCDTVYQQYHNSIDESETIGIAVYPNPANNILFVETCHGASIPDPTYRISNLMGQTVGKGRITAETQKIDIANLPFGMYFITINGATQKFVINR